MARVTGKVRLRVILDVTTGSSYGPEWTADEIIKQASREAKTMLENKLAGSLIKIDGEPVTTIVYMIEETK